MTLRVVPVGDVEWEPNDSRGLLTCQADGPVELSLAPHVDDLDRRSIRLVWRTAVASRFSAINDEGLWAHPLYSFGLDRLLWLGVVDGSDWQVGGGVDRGRRLRHFIAPLKECVVEVLAEDVEVLRGGSFGDAG